MKTTLLPLCFLMVIACGNSRKGTTTLPVTSNPVVTIENIPGCLAEQLVKIQNNQLENAPIQIDEYEMNGKKVYLYTADCCDQYNVLVDENCKGFCSPSGGITGKGDGKCVDFNKTAKLIRNIYKKG
jgi:hypothetical protein